MNEKKADAKIGRWFEKNKVKPALDELQERNRLYYHGFTDTHAAGAYVNNAPGDFLVVLDGVPILIECKASNVHETLRSCLSDAVENHQVGTHKLFMRALGASLFLFYSDATALVEFWPGEAVVAARASGKPIAPVHRWGWVHVDELAHNLLCWSRDNRPYYP